MCHIAKFNDEIVRNDAHCLTLAAGIMIGNKVVEDTHNEDTPCTRSRTDESNAMIKNLKENQASRMKHENTNDYDSREEFNRSINEFRNKTCND